MKKRLALLWLTQSLLFPCFGQNFSYHSISPFGIQTIKEDSTRLVQKVLFSDYDMDGDLDLLLTGLDYLDQVDKLKWANIHYFMEMQENIGDKWHPQFAERISVFEEFPFPIGYFYPSAGDLNDDGLTDFVISATINYIGNLTLTYHRNTGGLGEHEFEVIRFDSMGLLDFVPASFYIPELVDLDSDGDLDILVSGIDPAFGDEDGADIPLYHYAKNVGTVSEPDFVGWYPDPYGLVPHPLQEFLTHGDIDNDGDMDLLGFTNFLAPDSINYLYVHLNSPGPNHKPLFNTVLESPYSLPVGLGGNQFLFPDLEDIDGDGDLDLFVLEATPDGLTLKYFENGMCNVDNSVTVLQNTLAANQTGASYQWVNCDSGENIPGATNQSYNVTTTGSYAVNITDGSGCTVVSECISVIISGTEEERLSNDISLYPNPSDNWVYILNDTQFPVSKLTLINISGQKINEIVPNGNPIDISSLEQGIYFVKLKINGLEIIKKLIISD